MRNAPKAVVVQTFGTLFQLGTTGEWSDGDLLDRFVSREDETRSAAFEVLVDRHGPMVLDVCRNVLRDDHEAEDAFQATFLILARHGRSIRQRGSVGSWLFGVATRVASRAKLDAARRRARERAFAQDVAARPPSNSHDDAKAALHDEIARLPEKYREPIVLCCLEGISYQAAAERLGCPVGTVSVRLMRARERLRARLVRRCEAVPSSAGIDVLNAGGDRQPVAPALIASVAQHAIGLISGRLPGTGQLPSSITSLVQEVTMNMFVRQFVARAAASLILSALLVGSGVLGYQALGKGSHPATIIAQPPREGSGPAKASPEDPSQTALNRALSVNNLRQLGLAINAFHGANGFLPPAAIRDPNTGKPLLSWRVAVLPWIGSQELYQQFHLNEAWDSPHNKALLAKMPKAYAPVGVKTKDPFTTFYQVFVGPGTSFELLARDQTLEFTSIRDGTANTLAVVEAGSAVPWSKPEDLPFLPDKPLPPLGGLFKDGFNLVFLDASVFSVARGVDERLLKGLITRNGGEPVNRDQLPQIPPFQQPARVPVTPPAQAREVQVKKETGARGMDRAALAQVEIVKQAFKAIEERHKLGTPDSDEDYHKWSLRLLEAERATSTTKVEEIAALEAHFNRMKELSERAAKLFQNGERDRLQCLDTTYWKEEAAGWLQKAGKEAADPSR